MTRLSVVVPAYRNAATITETLRSILDQDVDDLEVIVADHSSDDGTADAIAKLADDPRMRVFTTPAGGGAGRNWNAVTDAATGDYVKLVCGDDVLRPGVLARQLMLLESSGAVLTACRRDVIGADGRVLMAGWGLNGLGKAMPGAEALRRTVRAGRNLLGEPACVMMRREALVGAGGWMDDFPYVIDLASYARVLLRGEFVPDTTVGATFRMSDAQWSVALVNDQSAQVRAFHAWIRQQAPEAVSEADRRSGDLRAALMARARRLSYRVLRRRMG